MEQKTERQCPMGMLRLLRTNKSYLGVNDVWEVELLHGNSTQKPLFFLVLT